MTHNSIEHIKQRLNVRAETQLAIIVYDIDETLNKVEERIEQFEKEYSRNALMAREVYDEIAD